MEDKQDNIILMMISFFINEMCESGIATNKEISKYFDECNEKEIKKMISKYKKIQSLTRSKAVKRVIELKKELKMIS